MPKISFSNNVIPINQIDNKQRKKIQKLYENAAKDVNKQIQYLESLEKQNASTQLQIYRLNQLKDSLNENLKAVTREVEKEIKANMQSVSEMTIEKYAEYLGNQQISLKVSYAHISNDIINNITSGNLYKDQYGADWNFSKRIWGDYNSAKGELASIVTNGMLSGKGCYEIAKDLEKYVLPNAQKPWEWSKVYPGTRKKIDYNAQRLARTMISHAYQQSLVEMSKNNPFASKIEWRSALIEHRTCELCEQRHGQQYKPEDLPLDHPNGLCTYLVVFDKDKKQIADELARWVKGEDNPELDKYATYLTGEDFSKMSKMQKTKNMKISKEKKKEINKQELQITNPDVKLIKSDREADKAFRDECAKVWNNLSTQEKISLFNYTCDSDAFNMPLRGFIDSYNNYVGREKTKKDNKREIDNVTSAISKSTYNKDFMLTRGLNNSGVASLLNIDKSTLIELSIDELNAKFKGQVITDYAFVSCGCAEGKGFEGNKLNILAPTGTQMMYCEPFSNSAYASEINPQSYYDSVKYKGEQYDLWNGSSRQKQFSDEQEMLLQRGTSFLIKSIAKQDNDFIIEMEIIGQNPDF